MASAICRPFAADTKAKERTESILWGNSDLSVVDSHRGPLSFVRTRKHKHLAFDTKKDLNSRLNRTVKVVQLGSIYKDASKDPDGIITQVSREG